MKIFKIFALALVLLLTVPHIVQEADAQTALTQTILSGAITANSSSMTVASATGFTATSASQTYFAYLGRELVRINSVSSTVIGISRGQNGTRAASHPANEVIFTYAPATNAGEPFRRDDPYGVCVRSSQNVQPFINTLTGDIWDCDSVSGTWEATNLGNSLAGFPYHAVIDAAYTAGLYDTFITYTSITSARTVTLPSITGILGKVMIIKADAASAVAITVAAPNGQFVTTSGTATTTVSAATTINPLRLISTSFTQYLAAGGGTVAWGWTTW